MKSETVSMCEDLLEHMIEKYATAGKAWKERGLLNADSEGKFCDALEHMMNDIEKAYRAHEIAKGMHTNGDNTHVPARHNGENGGTRMVPRAPY